MKFCDKLTKKRKENNLSQELLADRLDMSRQAISKWESGTSHPDMETIIKLCKILDCPIYELLDDDVIGDTTFKITKFNINEWIKDLLKFIGKSYNMFCSMNFREKLKCIIEMVVIVLLILLGWSFIGSIFKNLFINILDFLPNKIYYLCLPLLTFLFEAIGITLGFIITIYLFKIRYLDYYIIIEDHEIKEKVKEEPIKENQKNLKRTILESKKERVIIRDPKHSSFTFFNGIVKIIMFFIKLFLAFIAIGLIMSFIALSFGFFFSIFYLSNGNFFLGVLLFSLGCLGINFILLEIIYDIIFNRKLYFLRQFITFILSLIIMSLGIAISFNSYLKFDAKPNIEPYLLINIENIEMSNNLIFMPNRDYDVVIDNSLDHLKIESKELKGNYINIFDYNDDNYKVIRYNYTYNFFESLNLFLELLKDKKAFNYNYESKIKLYVSESNLKIIMKNIDLYNKSK